MVYEDYSVEDFLTDESFQQYCAGTSPEAASFWPDQLERNPGIKERFNEAVNWYYLLNAGQGSLQDQTERLKQRIQQASEEASLKKKVRLVRMDWVKRIAAVFIGCMLLGGAYYFFFHRSASEKIFATEYGNIKTITLPDNSVITLNANSKVTYKGARKNEPREVWLDGEAFFNVKHLTKGNSDIKPEEKFLVHTKDLTIEVLGTSFDVRQRRNRIEIVLQTGKIKISFADSTMADIVMNPGDWVIYNSNEKKLMRSATIPQNYTAWTEKKLILHDPSLEQIVAYLEDNFGRKIVLDDPHMGDRKVEGPILLDNLDDALFIISTTMVLDVVKTDSSIILRSYKK